MTHRDYIKELYGTVAAFHAADDAWLDSHIKELAATTDSDSDDFCKQLVTLPLMRSVELLEGMRLKYAKVAYSKERVQENLKSFEIRRMRLYTRVTFRALYEDGASVPNTVGFLDALFYEFHSFGIALGLKGPDAGEMALSQVIFHFALAYHDIGGRPIYAPSAGLAEALVYTEYRDLPASLMKIPHDAVFIEAPAHCGLYVPNVESGNHPLRGLYVLPKMPGGQWTLDNNAIWGVQVLLIGMTKPHPVEGSHSIFNDALMHFWLFAKEGETLGEVLNRTVASIGGLEPLQGVASATASVSAVATMSRFTGVPSPSADTDLQMWLDDGLSRTLRFVVNTLLYITLPDAELDEHYMDPDTAKLFVKANAAQKGSSKRAKLHAAFAKADKHTVVVLGSSVKIDRSQHKDVSDGVTGTSGHKLAVQYIRRGHWRNQPYGPRAHPQTRLQWIRPTSVGPKDAPLKKIVYELGH